MLHLVPSSANHEDSFYRRKKKTLELGTRVNKAPFKRKWLEPNRLSLMATHNTQQQHKNGLAKYGLPKNGLPKFDWPKSALTGPKGGVGGLKGGF